MPQRACRRFSIFVPPAALALAALTPAAASAQGPEVDIKVEIEVRNTATPTDDYLTWAPAPARIRLVVGQAPAPNRTVVLTNDAPGPVPAGRTTPLDGDVLFAESVAQGKTATQETLRLALPGTGAWTSFVFAGKFGRASTRDKDAVVEVHLDTADGPLVGTHALMVRVRKDARTLTDGERDRFLQAVADLHLVHAEYVPFLDIHNEAAKGKRAQGSDYVPDQSHMMAGFLPWHRVFLLGFERALQQRFPDVALPYWRLSEPSNVFAADFLGANQLADKAAPVPAQFAPGHPLEFWQIGGTPLMRFGANRSDPDALGKFAKEVDLLKPGAYASFRATVERNPHNNGHNWVGPWMQNCKISPSDPLFWVFHGEFDRLWAKWQWTWGRFGTGGSNVNDYAPTGTYQASAPGCDQEAISGCVPLGHWLADTMWPWDESSGPGVNAGARRPPVQHAKFAASTVAGLWPSAPASPKPADVIDYEGFGAGRLDMGFSYDDVPFGVSPSPPPPPPALKAAAAPAAATALARVLADREQSDELRILALERLHDADVRQAIDRALALLRDPQDGSAELDVEALELLDTEAMFTQEGSERHDEIHGVLRQALADPRRPVRMAAMASLAPMGDGEALRLLEESLRHPAGSPFVPLDAIRMLTLVGIGERAALVRPFLDDADPEVRAAAVQALLGDAASGPRIVRAIGDRGEATAVRDVAIGALPRGVPGAAEAVLALLLDADADPTLRARAASAVAFRLRAPEASEAEKAALRSGLRRLDPAELPRIGPAAEVLRPELQSPQ